MNGFEEREKKYEKLSHEFLPSIREKKKIKKPINHPHEIIP